MRGRATSCSRPSSASSDPGDPVPPLEHLVAEAAHPVPYVCRREWVARDDGGRLAGWARVEWMDTAANREHAKVRVEVPARLRRQGVGSRLLDTVTQHAGTAGRSLLGFATSEASDAELFLRARGAHKGQVFRISHLRVADVDPALLTGWVGRARERASGYSLVGWEDPCPPEQLERFTEVIHVMNTAPAADHPHAENPSRSDS
jgi:GNAT superfamily N-acetyltransferase